MSETTAIVTSIIGSAGLIVGVFGVAIRGMNKQFTQTKQRIDDVGTDLRGRLNDTRSELSSRLEETNRRLERVETLVEQIGRDIGELRDRTGKLEGTVSTFIQSQSPGG